MFLLAVALQNLVLMRIGMTQLPQGAFEMGTLIQFAGYSFLTSMPVLSFMLMVSSRSGHMWIPLGTGVAGCSTGLFTGIFGCCNQIWKKRNEVNYYGM